MKFRGEKYLPGFHFSSLPDSAAVRPRLLQLPYFIGMFVDDGMQWVDM